MQGGRTACGKTGIPTTHITSNPELVDCEACRYTDRWMAHMNGRVTLANLAGCLVWVGAGVWRARLEGRSIELGSYEDAELWSVGRALDRGMTEAQDHDLRQRFADNGVSDLDAAVAEVRDRVGVS